MVKRKLYERFRIAEYWIVDPELESIKIYRCSDKGYSRIAELSVEANDTLNSPLFPDWQLPLAKLFI
ncbi:MAG: Uma2 family endonuclease [Nitrospirota bacterium]|jgi:Uma2 family endonuclease|nr:Uma2 family endonuclease [Nitrospirota bacterium]MDH4360970.1 Uma2 family endonuclease [Nitrospirota bacterium]MDH5576037.1 Uma2 family endonuclease [Nitrospirota bacterium]